MSATMRRLLAIPIGVLGFGLRLLDTVWLQPRAWGWNDRIGLPLVLAGAHDNRQSISDPLAKDRSLRQMRRLGLESTCTIWPNAKYLRPDLKDLGRLVFL
jgi:hypothetical protein